MKLKTRIISLFLTVLMIVGLLPMSLFAVDGKASTAAGDEKYEGTKWTAPDLEDIVNAFYPDIDDPYNSSNWEKIFAEEDFSSLAWNGSSYTGTNGPKGNAYLQQGNAKNVSVISKEGDDKGALYFGLAPEGTGNGDYVEALTMAGISPDKVPVQFGKEYAGRDILISFDYKPETIVTEINNFLEIITRFQYKKDDGKLESKSPAGTYVLGLKKNEDGSPYLYLVSNGMKICDLPTGSYTNIKVLVDVGGPSAGTSSNMVYVFINNELKASGAFITDPSLITAMYKMEADGKVYPNGFCFCGARINRNAYKTNSQYVKDVETYYFGNTDTSRLTNIYAYLDFNEWTSAIGTTPSAMAKYLSSSSTSDLNLAGGSKIQSITSALAINNSYKSVNKNIKAVDDGNEGAAMQWTYSSESSTKEVYMDIANGDSANPYNKANAGRNFVFSIDVKLGKNIVTGPLIQMYTRIPAKTDANIFYLNSNGSLSLGGNGTDKDNIVGYLNSKEFTNLAVQVDSKNNLFYAYINGFCVNPEGSEMFTDATFKTFGEDGFAFHAVRLHQTNDEEISTTDREIYDNAAIYFLNDTVTGFIGGNPNPLNGFVKKGDYLYYYENGSLVANYDNGFVKTDSDGVVLLKKRTPFVDWEKTSKDKPYDQIANLADWNGKGDGYNQYYNHISSTVGKDASSLHLWSNMTNLGGSNTTFKLLDNDELMTTKTIYYNPGKGSGSTASADGKYNYKEARFLDISKYTDLEFDLYADGYQELVGMLFFGCDGDMLGVDAGKNSYYNKNVNFGSKTDYTTGYNGGTTNGVANTNSLTSFNSPFMINGWTTVNVPLSSLGPNRVEQPKDPKGNWIDSKQYISSFMIYSIGWSQLDYKYATANVKEGDYVLNGTDCRFLIKDFYLVNYEKVESLSQIAEYVGKDLVPLNEKVYFSGLYTAPSGNEYYYSAYDFCRVTDKTDYDIMGNETVTGYSFDANGVATPLNGVHTVQTKRTHLYVDGVMQKGSAADEFKVTVDGVDYRINAEGDYLGAYYFTDFMAEYPLDYTYTPDGEDANKKPTSHISSTDFGKDRSTMPVSASESVSGKVDDIIFVNNGGKLNVSAIVDDFFEDKNNVLKLDFVNSVRDSYAELYHVKEAEGKNTVLEYDVKLGEDWNTNTNIQFLSRPADSYNSADGTNWGTIFQINDKGELVSLSDNRVLYQFSARHFTKIAFVAKHQLVEDGGESLKYYDLKIDVYANGVKVAEDVAVYTRKSYKQISALRFAALADDSSNNRSGSIYFDNFAMYYGDNIVPQYVSKEPLKGVVGGKYYYDNGKMLVNETKEVDGVLYSADAEGWLEYYTGDDTGVSQGSNGKYYNFAGFAGRICDGMIDEKYYINGALKTGIFTTDDGKQMFADPNNENKLVKDGTITYDEKTYDIANYIATVRNGIHIFDKGTENEYAYFYKDGVILKDPRIYDGSANQYYFAGEDGKLIKQTGYVEMSDGYTYYFDGYAATLLHEIAFDGKYWRNGKVVKGEDITIEKGKIYSADADGNLRANGVFQANDGLYYNFDANYVGTLCDDFDIFDDVWYVDGKPAEGIQYVDETERYFEDGKPSAGRVQMPDGTVHEFGENGFRSSDDKKPHSIKLTLKYNGTEVTKEFYSYDGFGFTYTPINIDCMGYTITDKNGNLIESIDVAAVTEDLEFVITYNSDAKSHTPVMAEDTESTCTVAGQTTYVCAVCGEALPQLTVIKPLLDHKYIEVSRTESTCTVKGSVNYECEFCKDPASEELPLAAHTWDSGVRTAPTCTVAGKTVYTCTADGCGETKTVILPATGIHVWELTETVESTCAEMGHETYTCSVCKTTKQYDLPLLAHTYDPDGEYEILQKATETASGVLGYDCIVCKKKNAIAIEYAISYEGLQAAVLNGGTVMLMADITMTTETLRVSKDTVLELNGYDIVSENSDAITVTAGTLVINGDGEVKGGHYGDNSSLNAIYVSGTLFRKAKVIINGGTYNTEDCAAIYIGVNGNVEINGGYFKAEHTYNGYYWTLNLQDNSVGSIVVKGGQFENFDPSDTNTEPAGKSDNFVAEGYEVVVTEDATGNKIYTVVPEE